VADVRQAVGVVDRRGEIKLRLLTSGWHGLNARAPIVRLGNSGSAEQTDTILRGKMCQMSAAEGARLDFI
jgi:hypothetical protein